jgi:hypothetical protein
VAPSSSTSAESESPVAALERPRPYAGPRSRDPALWFVLSITALWLLCFIHSLRAPSPDGHVDGNLYAYQARAFLKGHLDIEEQAFDTAPFGGRTYVPFPPMPAIVLMPVVAAFGVSGANGLSLGVVLTLLNVLLVYRLARRLGLSTPDRVWLVLAMFAGTGYWYVVTESTGVWFTAHVVACTALFLAISEAWGKGRGHWVGLGLSAAFLSRQLTILAGLALAWRLYSHPRFTTLRARVINLAWFAAVAGLGLAFYLAFNHARFGDSFDTGYRHIPFGGFLKDRFEEHGLFSLAFVPFNLTYLLLQGFHLDFAVVGTVAQGARPDVFGTSLLAASPFVLVALFARRADSQVRALWISVAAIATGHLLYLNNGYAQVNTQRFSLDFTPLLLVLIAMGLRNEAARNHASLWRGCIGYALLLNVLSLVLLPMLHR